MNENKEDKAIALVKSGYTIAKAAHVVGVSEFWLRMKMDKLEGVWQ
jgi:hypothetical protein